MSSEGWLRTRETGVEIRVRVVPRSSREAIDGYHGDRVKIRLRAPPVEGEANEALCRFLARLAGLPRTAARVVDGRRSRSKTVLLSCQHHDEVVARLRRAVAAAVDNRRKRT